jgi:hypothetical protein
MSLSNCILFCSGRGWSSYYLENPLLMRYLRFKRDLW